MEEEIIDRRVIGPHCTSKSNNLLVASYKGIYVYSDPNGREDGWSIVVRNTYTIEMRVDVKPDETELASILEEAVKIAARQLYTQASLVLTGPLAPRIGVKVNNNLQGTKTIDAFIEVDGGGE